MPTSGLLLPFMGGYSSRGCLSGFLIDTPCCLEFERSTHSETDLRVETVTCDCDSVSDEKALPSLVVVEPCRRPDHFWRVPVELAGFVRLLTIKQGGRVEEQPVSDSSSRTQARFYTSSALDTSV
jgi:hypothetical protein